MNSDQIIFIVLGFLLQIGGIGFALVKIDTNAYEKDEKRFGPLSILNVGLGYHLLGFKYFRWVLVILLLSSGLASILYGFTWFQL